MDILKVTSVLAYGPREYFCSWRWCKSFASHLFETAQQSSNFTNIPPLGRGSFLRYCIFIRIPIPSPNRQPVIPVNKHSHVRYGKRIRNDSYLSPSSPYNSSFNLIVTKRVLEIDEWSQRRKILRNANGKRYKGFRDIRSHRWRKFLSLAAILLESVRWRYQPSE